MASFIKDVEEIRQRAMEKLEDGPVTATYKGDKDRTIEILNEALATEIVCVLRYMHHYFMATGVHGRAVAGEFKEHADAERRHGEWIAERIQQLGGKPDFNPASLLQRSVAQYVEGESLADMIREDLIAERIVIEVYQQMIRYFGNDDPTTRTMLEHILSEEEEHASDLSDLLYIVDPHTGEAEGRDPGADPLSIRNQVRRGAPRGAQPAGQTEQKQEDYQVGSSEDDSQARSRLDARSGSHPSPKQDVRGRDSRYDLAQQVGTPGQSQATKRDRQRGERRDDSSASVPGTSGRPMNRRSEREELDTDEVADRPNRGGMSGGTRSPKVLEKKRKNKRAA
jgi:bacterioferritin